MKKLGWVKTLALCLGIASAAACSSGGDDDGGSVVLPAFTDIPAAPAGTTGQIEFNAPGTWEISTDAMWLTFDPATGEKGNQTVTYTIDFKGQNFSRNEVANVDFSSMGQHTSFTITRESKPREIAFTDTEGNALTTIPVAKEESSGSNTIRAKVLVKANFNWAVASVPEWLIIEEEHMSGDAGEEKLVWLTIDPLKLEDTGMSGQVLFKDPLASDAPIQGNGLTVTFAGADDNTIVVKGFEEVYEVKFNHERKLADKTSQSYFEFQVIAKEGFKPVLIQQTPTGAANAPTEFWAHVAPQGVRAIVPNKRYWITVDTNDEAEREVEMYVLPKAVADLYDADPNCIFTKDEQGVKTVVKEEYQHFYACKIMQMSSGPGFVLGTSWGQGGAGATLNRIKGTSADLIAEYGSDVVYEWTIMNGTKSNYLTLSGYDHETYVAYDLLFDVDENNRLHIIDKKEPEPLDQISVYLVRCDWLDNDTAEDKTIRARLVQSKSTIVPVPTNTWETFGVLVITLKGTGSAQ